MTVPSFELSADTVRAWCAARGLVDGQGDVEVEELAGGVSATVIAVRWSGGGLVVKQALARLRVADVWEADVDRTDREVEAMRLVERLTPGVVPAVLAHDRETHTFAMELLPSDAANWQAEIGAGRAHAEAGRWAGTTLGTWHSATDGPAAEIAAFGGHESFRQQRLSPYHETVVERLPDLADEVTPYLDDLRSVQRCLVDGDYAPKNMLVASGGRRWKLDLEVAHVGNPLFDLGFFLSFAVLSAVRWPELTDEMRELAAGFLDGYAAAAGDGFAGSPAAVTGHTACLVLARTDGRSPALFLDGPSRERAREAGIALLRRPDGGLWSWLG